MVLLELCWTESPPKYILATGSLKVNKNGLRGIVKTANTCHCRLDLTGKSNLRNIMNN